MYEIRKHTGKVNMAFPLLSLFGLVGKGLEGFINHQGNKLAAKREKEIEGIKQEGNWESKMAEASNNSWKDEFWTIVLAFPLFVIFYAALANEPELIGRVKEAFVVLGQTPEWYRWALGAAIGAAFAVRKIIPMIGKGKGK